MNLSKDLLKDIFQWDVYNWSKALNIWQKYIPNSLENHKILEIGAGSGGLSLYFALKGGFIYCTDLENPYHKAFPLHSKYKCERIIYQNLDVLDMPFENFFDIVVFKSVLGGVSRNGQDEKKKIMINNVYKSLKKDGLLLFVENLQGCFVHHISRKIFNKWGRSWNYLKLYELNFLFEKFKKVDYETFGVLGCFGRNEKQRNFLGKIDDYLEKILTKKFHYILAGVAIK